MMSDHELDSVSVHSTATTSAHTSRTDDSIDPDDLNLESRDPNDINGHIEVRYDTH